MYVFSLTDRTLGAAESRRRGPPRGGEASGGQGRRRRPSGRSGEQQKTVKPGETALLPKSETMFLFHPSLA